MGCTESTSFPVPVSEAQKSDFYYYDQDLCIVDSIIKYDSLPSLRLKPYTKILLNNQEIKLTSQRIFKLQHKIYVEIEWENFKLQGSCSRYHTAFYGQIKLNNINCQGSIRFVDTILTAKKIPHLPDIHEVKVGRYGIVSLVQEETKVPEFLEIKFNSQTLILTD